VRGTGSRAFRRGMAGVLALLTLTLAACGSSGPAPPPASASPSATSAGAYLGCLLQHRGGGPGSAGKACASLHPGDLAAVLLTFENCLKAHGVTVPSLPAQGRRAALVQFVGGLRTGSAAQRSALRSCSPSGFPG
jgi:predicted small lipoprotein YifL